MIVIIVISMVRECSAGRVRSADLCSSRISLTADVLRRLLSILLLLLLVTELSGCSESENAIVLAIRARTQITRLEVWSKQYHDDGSVTLFQHRDFEIPSRMGRVSDNRRLLILCGCSSMCRSLGGMRFTSSGFLLASSRADPTSDRLVATICHDVVGVVAVTDVYLGRLTRGSSSLDVDGDTFPESLEAFCNYQANSGLPCDTTCNDQEYSAMIDCNPPADFEVPAGCGAIGEPADWHPFVEDLCGDCLDMDCYGGDTPCLDYDEDGYPEDVDCNDRDEAINPSVNELCGNDIDENCAFDIEAVYKRRRPMRRRRRWFPRDSDGYAGLRQRL